MNNQKKDNEQDIPGSFAVAWFLLFVAITEI
jgi:hypothetical protein